MIYIENLLLVLSTTLTGILVTIGGIITVSYAIKRKNRIIFLFSIFWLLYGVFWYLDAIAHYNYSIFIMSITVIPQLIGVPCLVIFIDLSRKEHVSTLRITILIIIELLVFLATFFLQDNWEIIPGYGVHNKGILRIFQIIFIVYFVFYYFDWSFRTWKRSPKELKKLTTYLLFGSTLFSIVSVIMYAIGSFIKLFNAIAFISTGVGAFITIMIVLKDPKIIYILPFITYRILVVDTNNGNTLFKHDWVRIGEVEENIFSMVLQAVGNILDEVLKKGEIREIQLDQAVLLIQHDKNYPVASVLVASKSSKSLKYSLIKFNEQFISKFQYNHNDLHNIKKFEDAIELINQIFDFIPKY